MKVRAAFAFDSRPQISCQSGTWHSLRSTPRLSLFLRRNQVALPFMKERSTLGYVDGLASARIVWPAANAGGLGGKSCSLMPVQNVDAGWWTRAVPVRLKSPGNGTNF